MIGEATIKQIDLSLQRDLKAELRAQGHYLTGALEASITSHQTTSGNTTVLEGEALDYADNLFEGIPPEHIDLNDPTYINGLITYAQKRFGLSGKEAVKAALAIAKKHSEEGMPTKASYAYSSTGERLNADIDAYIKHESEYDQELENGVSAEIDAFIDTTFDQTIF